MSYPIEHCYTPVMIIRRTPVVEWLKSLTSNLLVLIGVELSPNLDLVFIKLTYDKSMVLPRCMLIRRIIREGLLDWVVKLEIKSRVPHRCWFESLSGPYIIPAGLRPWCGLWTDCNSAMLVYLPRHAGCDEHVVWALPSNHRRTDPHVNQGVHV